MRKIKSILVGILAVGILAGFNAGAVFAEVPNGRVSEDAPEPAEDLPTTSSRPEAAESEGEVVITTETTEEVVVENEATTISEEAAEEIITADNTLSEMWPVYISLGGIALTLLLILIINLIHRKSKK